MTALLDDRDADARPVARRAPGGAPPQERRAGAPTRRIRRRAMAAAVLATIATVGIVATRGGDSHPTGAAVMPISPVIEDRFGVKLLGVELTGAEGIVQIRYQVLDRDRAQAMGDDKTAPVVVRDGQVFDVPALAGHGHAHRIPRPGTTGYVLFANTRGALHRGDRVDVKMADVTLAGITLG